jgi:hypothetical protein
LSTPFRTNPKSWDEVRRILATIKSKITDALGSMATQNADSVAITGGSIAGTDVDVSAATLTLADDQIDLDYIGTSETDTSKVVVPDGSGGLEFVDIATVSPPRWRIMLGA